MTEKHKRAQRIDEFLGALMILAGMVWLVYWIWFSSHKPDVTATHPAEVPQLEQTEDGFAVSAGRLGAATLVRMGTQG